MSEQPGQVPADLARQVRQHLDSLAAAGVQWLPTRDETPVSSPPVADTPGSPPPVADTPGSPPPVAGAPGSPQASDAPGSPPILLQPQLFGMGPASDAESPEQRRRELQVLAERVAGCERCAELVATRTQTVFGVGPLDPDLCFVGEAPGADEDRLGEPFVGQAGQLLNRIIAACGFGREEVYICNIIKCRPPGNRQPLPDEAGNCREYLERQLELVRPRFLCALGTTAAQNLLGTRASIGKLRGRFFDFKSIPVLCTYHPAALLPGRSPERKKDVWEDMKKLLTRMGRPIPGSGK
jgi:uracil-DNA glycosylase family 4